MLERAWGTQGLLVRIWNPADQYLSDGVRLLHAIFHDAITPKDSNVSIRTDNKLANEIKPVQFNENKVLMARYKTWKFTAEQVRYKRTFPTDYVIGKLGALFMFRICLLALQILGSSDRQGPAGIG
jgi:hypothetical protein